MIKLFCKFWHTFSGSKQHYSIGLFYVNQIKNANYFDSGYILGSGTEHNSFRLCLLMKMIQSYVLQSNKTLARTSAYLWQ